MPEKKKKSAASKSPKKGRAAVKFASLPPDPAVNNLEKIDHIVVLMMENRSFDHLLGYLKLVGGRDDIDGLTPDLSNEHNGKTYPVHHLTRTSLTDAQDPCHSGECVVEQLSGNNGGFVKNFAATRSDPCLGVVMGYYNQDDLPLYDHLASEFCVCDRWFASVPGATFPNRLYSLAGRADKSKDNKRVPLHRLRSFVRHLDAGKVSWRWYTHERLLAMQLATLQLIDNKYRLSGAYSSFDPDFIDHAAQGKLPAVSWIDPNFIDFGGSAGANDDHPPADVKAGQDLALRLYNALVKSPLWSKTLLIIVYDEHGGFYDHVVPPPAADDDPNFRSYGVRVPALVVSPWVGQSQVSHTVFDHTSITKTILLRFCRRPDGSIPDMGARVKAANHLGELLTETAPRPAIPVSSYQKVIDEVAAWHSDNFKARMMSLAEGHRRLRDMNELQKGLIAASKVIKRRMR
jgi:phospholipase C